MLDQRFASMDEKFDLFFTEIRELRREMRNGFAELRKELWSEIGQVRSEIGQVRAEMGELRAGMGQLQAEMLALHRQMNRLIGAFAVAALGLVATSHF
jgi:uncharacterized coiled-coil DUF342 family protein